jgi:hypothetical protein
MRFFRVAVTTKIDGARTTRAYYVRQADLPDLVADQSVRRGLRGIGVKPINEAAFVRATRSD